MIKKIPHATIISKRLSELRRKNPSPITYQVEKDHRDNLEARRKWVGKANDDFVDVDRIKEIVDLYEKGETDKDISKRFNKGQTWAKRQIMKIKEMQPSLITPDVEKKRKENHAQNVSDKRSRGAKKRKRDFTKKQIDKIVNMYINAETPEDIGKVFGMAGSWAYSWLAKLKRKGIITKTMERTHAYNLRRKSNGFPASLSEMEYEKTHTGSTHEYVINDIFFINDENVQGIDVEEQIPNSYSEIIYIDFLINDAYFEVFGDNRKGYDKRKKEKIELIPQIGRSFFWVDISRHKINKTSPANRTLMSYAEILDGNYQPKDRPKPYKDAVATLLQKIPLLTQYGIELCGSYAKTMEQLTDPQKQDLRLQLRQDTKASQTQPPTLEQIDSDLRLRYKSVDYWGELEKIAVYFKTQEAIMPYITQMQNELQQNQQEMQQYQKAASVVSIYP